jgi:hypothetical protein
MATLTPEQRHEIEKAGDEPVRIEDPETHAGYFIVKEEIFKQLRELLGEEEIDPSLYEFEDFEPLDS